MRFHKKPSLLSVGEIWEAKGSSRPVSGPLKGSYEVSNSLEVLNLFLKSRQPLQGQLHYHNAIIIPHLLIWRGCTWAFLTANFLLGFLRIHASATCLDTTRQGLHRLDGPSGVKRDVLAPCLQVSSQVCPQGHILECGLRLGPR